MRFTPKTEQEIADEKIWPKAIYPFEIIDAKEKLSQQAHNPMIELKVKITRPDGASRTITDYLHEKIPEKLRHCCAACGPELLEKYDGGILSEDDFVGRTGKLRLGIDKKNEAYPDRNVVADYVCGDDMPENGFFRAYRSKGR